MKGKLEQIKKEFQKEIEAVKSLADLEILDNKYLGRKSGALTSAMKELKSLAKEEIPKMGQLANEVKIFLTGEFEKTKKKLKSQDQISGSFDPTLPGTEQPIGHLHLVSQAIREISSIFEHIGFQRARYPEVEWDYYAFEALNMPISHPARDEWETFFIDQKPINKKLGQRILTPHTSSGQVREMEKGILPIRMMNISKTYRRQIDASHSPMFHQFEGLVIDKDINITHLKGTIEYFVKRFFGENREIRLRPHHFQFTEPSFEVDISCGVCEGRGCKLCKEGWLELAGAGLVHPNVLKAGKIDPNKYSGFAFGWGVERSYLMKSGLNIDDIRLLYKNDLRVINQF
ncbi:MAG: phenylalanine--tRNA ligase subunit alpha [Candidatus Buchananbacteria bacterium RIFCSPHIGHO2_02_FULL_40_13]|uniref:Phenylalanine--tRNA ligase alpha subunit n=1 Tax=Candidatus Buchananbacteria bacterium RIFCSPLOWO2_01_FULL_39_33 TaxID=1797543 RepID=A0A1G1YJB4_9BACT|nr:MAG: phenylalanine--tRNA ligase subunit alpha [Candidatus Buchananbacteria bacterium RIFCSPHIGHO2_02_FULL_40_13]OGY51790.1 MAG: phenylalanine--tRNA ligase subunit alpha [Candidatus Buchananbacteria bacterium RIFCSPLOWO2_01_FULL_39_33]